MTAQDGNEKIMRYMSGRLKEQEREGEREGERERKSDRLQNNNKK